jgi:hypothetical protein
MFRVESYAKGLTGPDSRFILPGVKIPDALTAWRTRHDLTQQEAADIAAVTVRTWQNWEAGDHEPPTFRMVELERAHPGLFRLLNGGA